MARTIELADGVYRTRRTFYKLLPTGQLFVLGLDGHWSSVWRQSRQATEIMMRFAPHPTSITGEHPRPLRTFLWQRRLAAAGSRSSGRIPAPSRHPQVRRGAAIR